MRNMLTLWTVVAATAAAVTAAETLRISRDDTRLSRSLKVEPGRYSVPDKNGDGVVHIAGDGLVIDFQGAELVGSTEGQRPNQFEGKGIVVTGEGVTIRNVKVRGYKVGIHAHDCPGLVIEDVDVSGNFQQRLLSTPEAENSRDWLWPHHNDNNEWMARYGAGLYVEDAARVTVRRVRARDGQNGIILDRVNDSRVFDNDCSFLSGWGLAMWRSNRNVISRNAFDFCVRGYSHGVYNRGQDSAGILMFEQCSDNVLAENSATHGGDGFFGFAGREALGEDGKGGTDPAAHEKAGCNRNLLIRNDFSYAPAHGIEMTFSFQNRFIANRLVENNFAGVWGGYSQNTIIADNEIVGNEAGGVRIEHGAHNIIVDNRFERNNVGVDLWWDNDAGLLSLPWAKANYKGAVDSTIANNTFKGDRVAIRLRDTDGSVLADNTYSNVGERMKTLGKADPREKQQYPKSWKMPEYRVFGEACPVGARKELRGRDKILITPWGPYDHQAPALFASGETGGHEAKIQVLGPKGTFSVTDVEGAVEVSPKKGTLPGLISVKATEEGFHPYSLAVKTGDKKLTYSGGLMSAEWKVRFFKWKAGEQDPRTNPNAWDKITEGKPLVTKTLPSVDFKWGGGAPAENVPADHFGTVAETKLSLPAGRYRVWTVSDDGIRVRVNGERVIDDWTHHVPTEHEAIVDLEEGEHTVHVEHFEINGMAQLQVRVEPAQ